MKRYGNLYEQIYSYENLQLAHKKAKKDKLFYKEVKMVDANEEYYLIQLQNMLIWKTYSVKYSDYTIFKKVDKNKEREIFKLDYFPHRIIQHTLMNVIQDVFLKSFISNTFASIPNRGIHLCLKKMGDDIKNDKEGTKYCLKMDIRKFYPNINHKILKELLRRKVKDKDVLWLIDMIIDSIDGNKGIAIGSLLSQWMGNFYLTYFDHWLKENKHIKYYYRYCDDLVILSDDKDFLHQIRKEIQQYLLNNLDLELKNNWQVFPTKVRGIDFVGYRYFVDYILLRKSTAKNMKKKLKKIYKRCKRGISLTYSEWCSINSYNGRLKWCNGYHLYLKYIKPLEFYVNKYYMEEIKK
ncbi:RNA-directed DNA polymerase [Clostridium tyrobutyricum]|uniref:RNA-directed DNA polymerase n=1 Tax=Clostridium tyrobutyricum TaxID=1519 RepID=UPI0024202E4D|nr:RNA-directed DNA polymerase [Clostridium tyrobutyricum]